MLALQNEKTLNISAHVPKSLADKLDQVSKFEERPKSYYIRKSLEVFLKERLEDIEDYIEAKQAYDEFLASGEKGVPLDEVFRNVK